MNIKKSSLIYQIWLEGRKLWFGNWSIGARAERLQNELEQANLCKFFWQTVFAILIHVTSLCSIGAMMLVGSTLAYATIAILGPIFGYLPTNPFERIRKGAKHHRANNLPWIWIVKECYVSPIMQFKCVREYRSPWQDKNGDVYPWRFLRPIAIIAGMAVVVGIIGLLLAAFAYIIWYELMAESMITQIIVFVVIGMAGIGIFGTTVYAIVKKTDTWQVIAGYAKAKKQRVCPMIDFVDE